MTASPDEQGEPQVAVVVVSHDTREHVLACLETIGRGADRCRVEVVVVDAGSSDGTVAAVRAAMPSVRVLELANTGYGRGANSGMRLTTAPVVVVANADVRFADGAIDALHRVFAEDERVAAVGPQVRYPSGSLQASARRRPELRTALLHALLGRVSPDNRATRRYHASDLDPSVGREVDWLSGCALGLRRSALEEVGGFDPGYFLFVEDVELADRLRAAGWHVRYEPAAVVLHSVAASTGARRLRSLVTHASSLDRYLVRRGRGPLAVAARPFVRVGLGLWVVGTYLVERLGRTLFGRQRSTTGERG